MQKFFIGLGLFIAASLTSCNVVADRVAKDYSVSLDQESISIAQGSEEKLTVNINVTVGFDIKTAITSVSLYDPPSGISAESISIPGGLSDGILTIKVSDTTPLGSYQAVVQTEKAGLGKRKDFEIIVTSANGPIP